MSIPAAIKGVPAAAAAAGGGGAGGAATVQEFGIRVPKNSKKKYNVMRFNATLNVDFGKWSQVKMERENNIKEFRGIDEEMPKFGAGSEFGRDAREEARRKKFGINSRKYKPDNQPWILKSGGKTGKKFKGIREGSINENTAYYVFTHAADGAIEAFPLQEWYNFQPIQRYKALSAEEAEQEFSRRTRTMNLFSLMLRKRLKKDEDGGDEVELVESGKKTKSREKELKISEMDEWMESDDDSDNSDNDNKPKKKSDDDNDDDAAADAKKKKKGKQIKKKKKNASDDEAFEESDDGDEEGRECDYISDSTDSESEKDQHKRVAGVDEEDAMRKLLASDDEDEDENDENNKRDVGEDNDDEDDDDDAKDKGDSGGGNSSGGANANANANASGSGGISKDGDKKKDNKKKKNKKNQKKKDLKKSDGKDSSSDFSSDSDTEPETQKSKDKDKDKDKDNKNKDSNNKKLNNSNILNSKSTASTPGTSSFNTTTTNITTNNNSTITQTTTTTNASSFNPNITTNNSFKRKHNDSLDSLQAKKSKIDNSNSASLAALSSASTSSNIPGLSESGITEEAVRRYLVRKPMTTTELLQKFKSKKTGLNSEQLVQIMTQILKKINPTKQTIQGKMYLSLKPNV